MNLSNFTKKRGSMESINISCTKDENCEGWTNEEDEFLLELRSVRQLSTWVEISSYFKGKNPKQCAYRFKKIWVGKEKNSWTREDDLKLLELVDNYGEDFETIRLQFKCKSKEELKQRYYKKINRHCINFSPDEDEQILHMYYNSFINSMCHKIILAKGFACVRRRLELLLKLKGENVAHGFDIASLIPLTFTTDKSTQRSSLEGETTLNTHSELMTCNLPQGSTLPDLSSFDESESICKSSSIYKCETKQTHKTKPIRKDSMCIDNYDYEYAENTDFDNEVYEGKLFETSFLNTFSKESFPMQENYCESNLDLFSCRSSNLEILLQKKKSLESVFDQLSSISQVYKEDLLEKVKSSQKLQPTEKENFVKLYQVAIKNEKELLDTLSFNSPNFDNNKYGEDYKNKLLKDNDLLESLIRVNKLKLKLVSKVVDAI